MAGTEWDGASCAIPVPSGTCDLTHIEAARVGLKLLGRELQWAYNREITARREESKAREALAKAEARLAAAQERVRDLQKTTREIRWALDDLAEIQALPEVTSDDR